MSLLNVGDVVQAVATLLDDPSQSEIDQDYVLPFLNLRWQNLVVNLVMLGLQYTEEQACIDLPAGTRTLTAYMGTGQPLASLMQPKHLQWKPQGADDTEFEDVQLVNELDDYPPGQNTLEQYAWQGGTIKLSRCDIAVTLRVDFQAMSVTLVDPTDNMVRGVTDIIAYRTAELIYVIRGNANLVAAMQRYGDTALEDFCSMSVMRSSGQPTFFPAAHRRGTSGVRVVLAPSINN